MNITGCHNCEIVDENNESDITIKCGCCGKECPNEDNDPNKNKKVIKNKCDDNKMFKKRYTSYESYNQNKHELESRCSINNTNMLSIIWPLFIIIMICGCFTYYIKEGGKKLISKMISTFIIGISLMITISTIYKQYKTINIVILCVFAIYFFVNMKKYRQLKESNKLIYVPPTN